MLEKCANPVCSMPFRRLGRGKLFAFERRNSPHMPYRSGNHSNTPSFFWLCDECSLNHTLTSDGEGNLKIEATLPAMRVLEICELIEARVEKIA